jgi:hypothetical protein
VTGLCRHAQPRRNTLELEATGSYADSRLAALQRSIDGARLDKPALARLADRIASRFIAAVLLATAVTALVWWQIDPERALWVALSVLVISCPCALSLATPASLANAAALLRRSGVIVYGENALESLARHYPRAVRQDRYADHRRLPHRSYRSCSRTITARAEIERIAAQLAAPLQPPPRQRLFRLIDTSAIYTISAISSARAWRALW